MSGQPFNPGQMPAAAAPTAGLYVHIPFCRTKCPYCSFNSRPWQAEAAAAYLTALKDQARRMAAHPWVKNRRFASLFIGGGTPTVYDGNILAELIELCLDLYNFSGPGDRQESPPEVSLEVNPNSLTPAKLHRLKKAGVNRLSIGVQSFSDPLLTEIGRSHCGADAEKAVDWAREAGFADINLDLMYGLPRQRLDDWQDSLTRALALAPTHLSLYELMIEEDTPFARLDRSGKLIRPAEEVVVHMATAAHRRLTAAGYHHYEISNFARPGRQCRHNINYWQNGSYLGLGAGAVSCFDGVRIRNILDPAEFTAQMAAGNYPFLEGECLPLEASFRETVIMGLRMTAGVSCPALLQRFGLAPRPYYGGTMAALYTHRLLEDNGDHLRLTRKGLAVANQVMAELV